MIPVKRYLRHGVDQWYEQRNKLVSGKGFRRYKAEFCNEKDEASIQKHHEQSGKNHLWCSFLICETPGKDCRNNCIFEGLSGELFHRDESMDSPSSHGTYHVGIFEP